MKPLSLTPRKGILIFSVIVGIASCTSDPLNLPDPNHRNYVHGWLNNQDWSAFIRPNSHFDDRDPSLLSINILGIYSFESTTVFDGLSFYNIPVANLGDTISLIAQQPLPEGPTAYYDIVDYDAIVNDYYLAEYQSNWIYLNIDDRGDLTGSFHVTMVSDRSAEGVPSEFTVEAREFRMEYPE